MVHCNVCKRMRPLLQTTEQFLWLLQVGKAFSPYTVNCSSSLVYCYYYECYIFVGLDSGLSSYSTVYETDNTRYYTK